VQRQYTGSAGKVTNCQIGVSLSVATRTEQLPIDFELYLPESWTEDPARRREGRIPDSVQFQTKPQLGLAMVRRAIDDGLPRGPVLADSAYGSSSDFRQGLRDLSLDYAVGVDPKTVVWVLDAQSRCRGDPVSVRDLALRIEARGGFRRCTWRKGTKHDLSARFALRRVTPAGVNAERAAQWLLIEWRDGEQEPANYFLATLPENITKRQLIRLIMQRWRTERVYEDLKGELGLDHFEGRRFRGWHHHVSVALCCYAFIVAERLQRSPPRPEGRWDTTRSHSRPERHFPDSFITARLSIARTIAGWLPRCPACHRPRNL
jgi:SRSO17 transposase